MRLSYTHQEDCIPGKYQVITTNETLKHQHSESLCMLQGMWKSRNFRKLLNCFRELVNPKNHSMDIAKSIIIYIKKAAIEKTVLKILNNRLKTLHPNTERTLKISQIIPNLKVKSNKIKCALFTVIEILNLDHNDE